MARKAPKSNRYITSESADFRLSAVVGKQNLVLFDLETSGLKGEILQIGAKCGSCTFSCYIKPKGPIPSDVTAITKLSTSGGQLHRGTHLVPTVSLQVAMQQFVHYLTLLQKMVYFCSHNLAFDGSKLHKALCECNFEDKFLAVVRGMSCSLKIIRNMRAKTEKNSIEVLTTSLGIEYVDGHDALSDTQMLALIIKKLDISDDLITSSTDAYNLIQKYKPDEILSHKCKQLLSDCKQNVSQENIPVGKEIVKKIISSNISVACLQKAYNFNTRVETVTLPARVIGTTVDKLY
ncbi:uncharacterized protein LOC127749608 [Frankliniella occidentalis]|uniref:Uncharacterized protein LOC127749608 n=1 Tax=Frankliniella occidentalis TaxID=133901 RepID=A0A9C6U1E6_FRAOC|nr:uncharacterized protein LOC127749608 [Frankliniella occidentalis]